MNKDTKCIRSTREGRFKVSLLEKTRIYKQREMKSNFIAIQHGRKISGVWENQTIFCSTEDFKNLQEAIDEFIFLKDEEGDKTPKSTPNNGGDEE